MSSAAIPDKGSALHSLVDGDNVEITMLDGVSSV